MITLRGALSRMLRARAWRTDRRRTSARRKVVEQDSLRTAGGHASTARCSAVAVPARVCRRETRLIALRNALEQATEELVATEACWRRAVEHLSPGAVPTRRGPSGRDAVRDEVAQQQAQAAAAAERDVHVRHRRVGDRPASGAVARSATRWQRQLDPHVAELRSGGPGAAGRTADLSGRPAVDRRGLEQACSPSRNGPAGPSTKPVSTCGRRRSDSRRCKPGTRNSRQAPSRRSEAVGGRAPPVEREQALVTLGRLAISPGAARPWCEADGRQCRPNTGRSRTTSRRRCSSGTARRAQPALELAAEVERLTQDVHRDEVLRAGKRATLDQLTEKALEEFGLTARGPGGRVRPGPVDPRRRTGEETGRRALRSGGPAAAAQGGRARPGPARTGQPAGARGVRGDGGAAHPPRQRRSRTSRRAARTCSTSSRTSTPACSRSSRRRTPTWPGSSSTRSRGSSQAVRAG